MRKNKPSRATAKTFRLQTRIEAKVFLEIKAKSRKDAIRIANAQEIPLQHGYTKGANVARHLVLEADSGLIYFDHDSARHALRFK
jgi:hypothetical protein